MNADSDLPSDQSERARDIAALANLSQYLSLEAERLQLRTAAELARFVKLELCLHQLSDHNLRQPKDDPSLQ